MSKIGRNDPCPCGSGKKYKHCCLGKEPRVAPLDVGSYGSMTPAALLDDSPQEWGMAVDGPDGEARAAWPTGPLATPPAAIVPATDESPSTPRTRALELSLQGWRATGDDRVEFARQALAEDPDCIDAYALLADSAAEPDEAIRFYEEALAAADRVLEPGWRERYAGNIPYPTDASEIAAWEDEADNTVSYIHARYDFARFLLKHGRVAEAIGHLQDLLAIEPEDLHGARFDLLGPLVAEQRDDEALALITEYADGFTARWDYARALLRFRAEGDSASARRALTNAFAINDQVPPYLLGTYDLPPADQMGGNPFSDRFEATGTARSLIDGWRTTPGALDWPRDIFEAGPAGNRASQLAAVPAGNGPPFSLTDSESTGYVYCPRRESKTLPRKRDFVAQFDADTLVIARLACRVCDHRGTLCAHESKLHHGLTSLLRHRKLPYDSQDAAFIGIIDPAAAESRPPGIDEAARAASHLQRWSLVIPIVTRQARWTYEPEERDEIAEGAAAEADESLVIDVPFATRD